MRVEKRKWKRNWWCKSVLGDYQDLYTVDAEPIWRWEKRRASKLEGLPERAFLDVAAAMSSVRRMI